MKAALLYVEWFCRATRHLCREHHWSAIRSSTSRTTVAPQLEPALNRYFSYRAEAVDRDLRDLFRVGWRSLAIGLAALAACVLMSTAITRVLGMGTVSRLFEEGLIILGWVANWKPIQTFLYDWWPVARRRDLYRRLARARVELQAVSSDATS